jgi:Zn finger protein HypA/HybF involved in hydrogenase expression
MATIDDFMKDSAGSPGNRGKYLGNWKGAEDSDGEVTIWLAKMRAPESFYTHGVHRIDVNREDKSTRVRNTRFNCMEPLQVLGSQYRRNSDGEREDPPTVCPHCLLIEWVRAQIQGGKLSWTDELFVYDADEEPLTINTGGYAGLYKSDDLTTEEKKELKEARVNLKKAYRQNAIAKLKYLFCVVNGNAPNGVQLAIETKMLGDKMRAAIRNVSRAAQLAGREPRDPMSDPYPFLWKFDEHAAVQAMYDVVPLPDIKPSEELADLLEMDPPDIGQVLGTSDLALHRSILETACVIEGVPWDEIFGPAEAKVAKSKAAGEHADAGDDDEDDDFPPAMGGKGKPRAPLTPEVNTAKVKAKPEEQQVQCEVCSLAMDESAMTCPHCKATYEDDFGEVTLATRACETCGATAPFEDSKAVCPKCGTVHAYDGEGTWTVTPGKRPAAAARRRTATK